jgi:hypothetical protein
MRGYSNLDSRIYGWTVAQFVPLTFERYVIDYSLNSNQRELIKNLHFYTIKNDVIYGHFNYDNCFYTYNYISNTDIMTYNHQEYFNLVKEHNYPHPLQFKSPYYWLIIYQNPLYSFLIRDSCHDELINSLWFKKYCEYETENK